MRDLLSAKLKTPTRSLPPSRTGQNKSHGEAQSQSGRGLWSSLAEGLDKKEVIDEGH